MPTIRRSLGGDAKTMDIDIKRLLQLMVQNDISDIHFKADSCPVYRLHGSLVTATAYPKATPEDLAGMADQLMNEEQKKRFAAEQEADMAYNIEGVSRFRVNVCMQRGSICLTLRVIPAKLRTFEELNLPVKSLENLSDYSRGIILFAGITGAGKTTTMNSYLGYLNERYDYRVVTVEDPIEYYHEDIKCSIIQREVGRDTKSFAAALKHILRQDPDIIVIGEMRDLETMQAALNAAETGHLVLSTVHTMDAARTLDRIVDAHPPHQQAQVRQQLSGALKGIVAQRLVSTVSGQVRYPATEVLIGNSLIRTQIQEGKTEDILKAMEGGAFYGMHTFDQDLFRLCQEGKISEKVALENSTSPQDLTLKIRGLSSTTGI